MTRYFNLLASGAVSSALFMAGANVNAQAREHWIGVPKTRTVNLVGLAFKHI